MTAAKIALLVLALSASAAACVSTTPPRFTPPHRIPFAELTCGTRDGTATCAFVDRNVACCAVQADGTEASWRCATDVVGTLHWSGVPEPIPGLIGAVEVDVGRIHTCARMIDGTVRCVGSDMHGALGRGTYRAMDAITAFGTWAPNSKSVGVTREGVNGDHVCGLMGDGAVHCAPASKGLHGPDCAAEARGDGVGVVCNGLVAAGLCRMSPVALTIPGLHDVAAISGDCAIMRDRSVRCWGDNGTGQIHLPESDGIPVPTSVPQLHDVRQIDGDCAVIESTGKPDCFRQHRNYVEHADVASALALVDSLTDVEELRMDAGGFGCARAGGKVRCWGDNSVGQLGRGTHDRELHPPANVPGLDGTTQLAGDGATRCALRAGHVYCWGRKHNGSDDNDPSNMDLTPREIAGLPEVKRIAMSGGATCVIAHDDSVWCWGRSPNRKQAEPRSVIAKEPLRIEEFGRVARLRGGAGFCAIDFETRVICWGGAFGEPDRVTGTRSPRASFAFGDDDLLPPRHTTPPRLVCDSTTLFCIGDYCFESEDACLDARAAGRSRAPCIMQAKHTFTREVRHGERTPDPCMCTGDKCVTVPSRFECAPVDPEDDRVIPIAARAKFCEAHPGTSTPVPPAPRSTHRGRYCAHWTNREIEDCGCHVPVPPHLDSCRCPTIDAPEQGCFLSLAECEAARAHSSTPHSSSTDPACVTIEP